MTEDKSLAPANEKKYLLLCTLGATPAVVIETLVGLLIGSLDTKKWPEGRFPDEVHLLVTYENSMAKSYAGWRDLVNAIFQCAEAWKIADASRVSVCFRGLRKREAGGSLRSEQFCDGDSGANAKLPVFVDWTNDEQPLVDVRTNTDNLLAADYIAGIVAELTGRENSVLHASIAGGRKTMSAHLQTAMAMFMRPQDSVSHVLVDSDLADDHSVTAGLKAKCFFAPCSKGVQRNTPINGSKPIELAESPVLPMGRLLNQKRLRALMSTKVDIAKAAPDPLVPLQTLLQSLEREQDGWQIEVDWTNKKAWFCGRPITIEGHATGKAFCLLATLTWWANAKPSLRFPTGTLSGTIAPDDLKESATLALQALIRYVWALVVWRETHPRGVRDSVKDLFLYPPTTSPPPCKLEADRVWLATYSGGTGLSRRLLDSIDCTDWRAPYDRWRTAFDGAGLKPLLTNAPLLATTVVLPHASQGTSVVDRGWVLNATDEVRFSFRDCTAMQQFCDADSALPLLFKSNVEDSARSFDQLVDPA